MIARLFGWALVLTASAGHAACERTSAPSGTVTVVNRVRGTFGSDSCPNCASSIEAALRQRLDAAAIAIDPDAKTVDLTFERSSPFASGSFREAVTAAGGETRIIEIDACGTVDTAEGRSWITSGSTRLLLEGAAPPVAGVEVCVTGELQDLIQPPKLVVGSF